MTFSRPCPFGLKDRSLFLTDIGSFKDADEPDLLLFLGGGVPLSGGVSGGSVVLPGDVWESSGGIIPYLIPKKFFLSLISLKPS